MFQIRIKTEEIDTKPIVLKVVNEVAEAVPESFRQGVDAETARGRLYRRGSITARLTKSGLAAGFRQTSKSRMAVGSRFHRASAKGQFPARDTDELYKRIRITGKGTMKPKVIFDAPHAGFVEEERPFIDKTMELVVQRFI